jgi:hypothetical protein
LLLLDARRYALLRSFQLATASMSDTKTHAPGAQLVLREHALRAAIAGALAGAGFSIGEAAPDLLVLDAGAENKSLLTPVMLAPEALAAIARFAGNPVETQRSIILVADADGPAREAFLGSVRALARALAPGLRVNGLAPLNAGEAMDVAQAGMACAYLACAVAVTGQVIEIAASKGARVF